MAEQHHGLGKQAKHQMSSEKHNIAFASINSASRGEKFGSNKAGQ